MDIIVKISPEINTTPFQWKVDIMTSLDEDEKNGNLNFIIEQIKVGLEKLRDNMNTPFQQNVFEHIYFYGN